jgi:hypothetical protein
MASSQYSCSLKQAFDFEKDLQILVGHVKMLTVAEVELTADISITNPMDSTGDKVTVVGPITDISWAGGYADPVHIQFNVSSLNQSKMLTLKHSTLSKTDVVFQFCIYAFDQVKHVYYEAFWSDDGVDMNALLLKSGGDLAIDIAAQNDPTIKSPYNYNAYLGLVPTDAAEQALLLAFSVDNKVPKKWGIKAVA